MGYIPYIQPQIHHSDSSADPNIGVAFWIACHVLPLMVMLASFIYNVIKKEWYTENPPPMFEFFGIWLCAVFFIDILVLITSAIMLLL